MGSVPRFSFYYQTGEAIRVGDEILAESKRPAIVTEVLVPDSKRAKDWGLPQGGVMIEEDWDGRPNPVFYSSEKWIQALTFVRRCATG